VSKLSWLSKSSTAKHRIGGARGQQISSGKSTQISLERRRQAIPLGGAGRGCWGEYFAQGGGGDNRGVGRNGQATAAAIQSPEGRRGPERRVRGAGLGRFDRPRPEPGG
jgi:hypothetical protein